MGGSLAKGRAKEGCSKQEHTKEDYLSNIDNICKASSKEANRNYCNDGSKGILTDNQETVHKTFQSNSLRGKYLSGASYSEALKIDFIENHSTKLNKKGNVTCGVRPRSKRFLDSKTLDQSNVQGPLGNRQASVIHEEDDDWFDFSESLKIGSTSSSTDCYNTDNEKLDPIEVAAVPMGLHKKSSAHQPERILQCKDVKSENSSISSSSETLDEKYNPRDERNAPLCMNECIKRPCLVKEFVTDEDTHTSDAQVITMPRNIPTALSQKEVCRRSSIHKLPPKQNYSESIETHPGSPLDMKECIERPSIVKKFVTDEDTQRSETQVITMPRNISTARSEKDVFRHSSTSRSPLEQNYSESRKTHPGSPLTTLFVLQDDLSMMNVSHSGEIEKAVTANTDSIRIKHAEDHYCYHHHNTCNSNSKGVSQNCDKDSSEGSRSINDKIVNLTQPVKSLGRGQRKERRRETNPSQVNHNEVLKSKKRNTGSANLKHAKTHNSDHNSNNICNASLQQSKKNDCIESSEGSLTNDHPVNDKMSQFSTCRAMFDERGRKTEWKGEEGISKENLNKDEKRLKKYEAAEIFTTHTDICRVKHTDDYDSYHNHNINSERIKQNCYKDSSEDIATGDRVMTYKTVSLNTHQVTSYGRGQKQVQRAQVGFFKENPSEASKTVIVNKDTLRAKHGKDHDANHKNSVCNASVQELKKDFYRECSEGSTPVHNPMDNKNLKHKICRVKTVGEGQRRIEKTALERNSYGASEYAKVSTSPIKRKHTPYQNSCDDDNICNNNNGMFENNAASNWTVNDKVCEHGTFCIQYAEKEMRDKVTGETYHSSVSHNEASKIEMVDNCSTKSNDEANVTCSAKPGRTGLLSTRALEQSVLPEALGERRAFSIHDNNLDRDDASEIMKTGSTSCYETVTAKLATDKAAIVSTGLRRKGLAHQPERLSQTDDPDPGKPSFSSSPIEFSKAFDEKSDPVDDQYALLCMKEYFGKSFGVKETVAEEATQESEMEGFAVLKHVSTSGSPPGPHYSELYERHPMNPSSTLPRPQEKSSTMPVSAERMRGKVVTFKTHSGFIKPIADQGPSDISEKDVYFSKQALCSKGIKEGDEVESELDLRQRDRPTVRHVWSFTSAENNVKNKQDVVAEGFDGIDNNSVSIVDEEVSNMDVSLKLMEVGQFSENEEPSKCATNKQTVQSQEDVLKHVSNSMSSAERPHSESHKRCSINSSSTLPRPQEKLDVMPVLGERLRGKVVTLKSHYGFIKPLADQIPSDFSKKDVYFSKRALCSKDIQEGHEVEFELHLRQKNRPSARRVWSLTNAENNLKNEKDIVAESFDGIVNKSISTVDEGISETDVNSESIKVSQLSINEGSIRYTTNKQDKSDNTDKQNSIDPDTSQSKVKETVPSVKTKLQLELRGRVCGLKKNYGFLKPLDNLPEGYSEMDVHFYFNKVSSGFLPLAKGDEVEFSLGTIDKDKPMAVRVKVVQFRHRNVFEIRSYLRNVTEKLNQLKLKREGIISEGKEDSGRSGMSEYLVTILTCLPAWMCVCNCYDLIKEDVLILLQLFLNIEQYCQSLKEVFCKVVEVLTNSKFFSVTQGSFKRFIATSVEAEDLKSIIKIQEFLLVVLQYSPGKVRAVAKLVKPLSSEKSCASCKFLYCLLKEATKMSAEDISELDWDELPLVPTTDELLSDPLENGSLDPIKKVGSYTSIEEYMNIYFRLLRADCFYKLKKGLCDMKHDKLDARDMNVYCNINLIGIHVSHSGVALCLEITPQKKIRDWDRCSNLMFGNLLCISVSGNFKDAIWATVVSRELLNSRGAVMIELCSESNMISESEAIIMLQKSDSLSLMVESPTYYRAYQPVLKALQRLRLDKFVFKEELLDSKSQGQSTFTDNENCFDAEILYSKRRQQMNIESFLHDPDSQNKSVLDSSQEAALREALSHRVAIIQGPPGTGKTFIGIKLVQLLLSISPTPSLPILVLTYKNHALDEFMKELIPMYPNEVVRIGGRSQDPAITKCNLNELKKAKMSETLFKEIQRLRSEVDRLKHDVDKAFKALSLADQFDSDCFLNNITVQQVVQLLINCNWSKTQVKSFKTEIKRNEIEFTEVRKKGDINSITKDEVEVIISELDRIELNTEDKTMAAMYNWPDDLMTLIDASIAQWIPDQNIFAKVNQQFSLNVSAKRSSFLDKFNSRKPANEKRKSTVDDNTDDERDADDEEQERLTAAQGLQGGPPKEQLLKEIVFTKDSNHSANHPRLLSCVSSLMSQSPIEILINAENLWELSHEDRVAVIQFMILQQFEEAGRNFEEALRNFEDVCSQKIELENQHKIAIMTDKKVVGMTITGASIHNEFLGQLRPAIMIVEEAAEVQESQLIAALGDWTEYLIMIGDHKQLRPKVESHVLARDFHMDVSMMERLIANKFPYATLRLQNRMRPEFAKLLSDIYPDLESNLERVESNAPANCIYYSSFFWDHTDLEPNLKSRKFGRIKQEIKPRSYINEGEADRAIMLALFLIQQGYEPRQITILAAYQGQSVLLRKKCRQAEKGYPQLFDRYKLHDDSKASSDLENKIRIHTIDMYQGDENDFVIISLVRSNPAGIIGFLDSFNRRCVAQSRSRCGLYFIGNASTLSFRRSWGTLIQTLHEQNRLDSSIPLNCPNHREETIIRVRSSNDLRIGQKFCKLQCIFQMSCGKHQCRRLCQPPHHHDDECRETVTFTHPKCRHKGEKECHEDESKMNCHKMVPVKFSPCGHQKDVKCYEKDQVSCKERCTRKLEDCGHMCQQECGEVCRPEDCSFCAKLREEEAMKRRKADEESIKVAKREVEKQLEELKKKRGSSPSKFERKEIHPNGDTASEYYDTYDRVMKYIQPGHSWFPVIKKIEKVTNNDLELKWLRAKKQLFDPRRNELKFHGTSLEGVEGIIKDGFRMPKPGNQMYGAGIYFASDSSKSAQEIYTKGSGMLLLCDVLLGKSLTVDSAEHNMDLEELKQRKYDSLYAKRGTRSTHGVLYDEFVVFNPDQAIPRYIIHYAKEKLKTIEQVDDLQKKAIASGETKKYVIRPNREVNLRDPLEVHYRIAESQFLRLIHHSGRKKTITSVDYYINPRLISKFRKKKEELKKKYGKGKESKYILAFHGTKPDNVEQIMSQNFRLDKIKRTVHGFGIYFSEFPDISIGYGSGLILCKILPGRSYRGDTMPSGYDSNIVDPHEHHQGRADMVIIGNPDQILPCYVIHFSS